MNAVLENLFTGAVQVVTILSESQATFSSPRGRG